jgi:RNA-directed DNA polymerase
MVNAEAAPEDLVWEAERRVLAMQTKLHCWAVADPGRRFDDVFNLVCDPWFLLLAWDRVRTNKGGRTAGVDRIAPKAIPSDRVLGMLAAIRDALKAGTYKPLPVRAVQIPKANGKVRQLGIPGVADRIVQASLKLVLEPIFEADFDPASYGFRPMRRAQDAIAEIHYLTTRGYEWVFEADIKACFDNIDHQYLMREVSERVKDKRTRALIWRFLKAGVMSEEQIFRPTDTGTPQGGILSPLLANIALSALDRHFRVKWEEHGPTWARAKRRRAGVPMTRMVRYADDFVVLVYGQRSDADALFAEVACVLEPAGLSLSEEKTKVAHIDEGFDFLGWRVQRQAKKRADGKRYVYTYPSRKSLNAVIAKIRDLTRPSYCRTLADLLKRINPVMRGWCNYFRHGVSKATFSYLDAYAFGRVLNWLLKRHPKLGKRRVVRRFLPEWRVQDEGIEMFRPERVPVTRYRYRGTKIPTPWTPVPTGA